MIRKALIVANEGKIGTPSYLGGVEKDTLRYRNFLLSAVGGLWREDEIKVLRQPGRYATSAALSYLRDAEYSIMIFTGHGYHSTVNNSTIVELSDEVEIDSHELRLGAERHTLILDCCRVACPPIVQLREERLAKAMDAKSSITASERRRLYNLSINKCPRGLIVLYACSIDESAGDSAANGGYYSQSLIDQAEIWSRRTFVNTSGSYEYLSVVEAHNGAEPIVDRLSGGHQTPAIDKNRSGPNFPFSIIA